MSKEILFSERWYNDLIGLEHLYKYPDIFIDWMNEDTWALTIAKKNKVTSLIQLFDLWVNEKY